MHEAAKAKVRALCEEEGYGFVMQVASQMWKELDSKGAIVTGPCVYFTVPCECAIPGNCNNCYGCGWQFKRKNNA